MHDGKAFAPVHRRSRWVNIKLNGEIKTLHDNITVLALLEFLQIQHQRVAVELNESIVKKDKYGSTAIKDGDILEVVSFMGGGTS